MDQSIIHSSNNGDVSELLALILPASCHRPEHLSSAQTARRADSPCAVEQITSTFPAIPPALRGAYRDRHGTLRRGVVAAGRRSISLEVRTNVVVRTVKPCGPDTPTLVSWSATMSMTGASKPGPLGERGAAVQTIAQGRPGCFRLSLWFLPRAYLSHGGRGCQSALGLPCALSSDEDAHMQQSSGRSGREVAGAWASTRLRLRRAAGCLTGLIRRSESVPQARLGGLKRPASRRRYAGHASPFGLRRGCATRSPKGEAWCPGAESNHRHCDFQSHALPTELPGQVS